MAFPPIEDTNTSTDTAGTSHTVNLPPNISTGDLLIVFFGTDGDNTVTDWDGFTELGSESNGTAAFFAIAYKIATGGEGATITVTTSVSEPSSHASYRITGHDSGQAPELSTVAESATDQPDPTTCTPTGGAKDYLWIHACGWDRNRTVSAWNANFTLSQLYASGGGSQDCSVGISGRNENVASKDPTYITLSASDQWIAWTVAVHPTAGGVTYEIFKDSAARIKGTITVPVDQTTSDARIKATGQVADTPDSDARILVKTKFGDRDSDARILGTQSLTPQSAARILGTQSTSTTSAARITAVVTYELNPTSAARIKGTMTGLPIDPMASNARILGTLSLTPTSAARILETFELNPASAARILGTIAVPQNSDARILALQEITPQSAARIFGTIELNPTSEARIFGTIELNPASAARIKALDNEITPQSAARILAQQDWPSLVQSAARILAARSLTPQSAARIFGTQSTGTTSAAKIITGGATPGQREFTMGGNEYTIP